jgi:HAD superfamily hydrolase (TIGR01509 family)
VVDELRDRGVPVYVLSNSSAETLPRSPVVQDIFRKFNGVVLSGAVGLVKPDAAIFQHTAEMYGLRPATTWFVDDSEVNVAAANALGWNGVHYTGPDSLDVLRDLQA